MKKFENFSNCLKVLKKADFEQASESEIYRLMDLFDCEIESPEDAEYAIHQVIEYA